MSHGGKREGSGRKKGVPNKSNADLKAMILGALNNKGGITYLEEQADKNPVAFMSLVGKVLPMTITGDPDAPLKIQIVSGVPRDVPDDDDDVADHEPHQSNGHAGH